MVSKVAIKITVKKLQYFLHFPAIFAIFDDFSEFYSTFGTLHFEKSSNTAKLRKIFQLFFYLNGHFWNQIFPSALVNSKSKDKSIFKTPSNIACLKSREFLCVSIHYSKDFAVYLCTYVLILLLRNKVPLFLLQHYFPHFSTFYS